MPSNLRRQGQAQCQARDCVRKLRLNPPSLLPPDSLISAIHIVLTLGGACRPATRHLGRLVIMLFITRNHGGREVENDASLFLQVFSNHFTKTGP
jgi:hypothetical protein